MSNFNFDDTFIDLELISDEDDGFVKNIDNDNNCNHNLLKRLLNEDIDNEETLLDMSVEENLVQLVLNPKHLKEQDFLSKILNFIRRLTQIHDDVIDSFLEDDDKYSLFSFVFDLMVQNFEQICLVSMIDFEDLYFSVYDYCCSILVSFIATLNAKQVVLVTNILFRNLLSPVFLKSLLAADILIFMCRFSNENYAYDIFKIAITILDEIYFDDVLCKEYTTEHITVQQIQNILISFLDRLIIYFSNEKLELLFKDFPYSYYDHIFRQINCSFIPQLSFNETQSMIRFIGRFSNEETFIHTILTCLDSLKPDLDVFTENHSLLSFLKCFQESSQNEILKFDCNRFTFLILRLLNEIPHLLTDEFIVSELEMSLADILGRIFNQCKDNFILCQHLFTVVQNLTCNDLLSEIITHLASDFKFKNYFKLFLNCFKKSKFMEKEERELYICGQLKELNDSVIQSSMKTLDIDHLFTFPNVPDKNSLPIGSIIMKPSANLDYRMQVLSDMQYSLSLYQTIDSISSDELECFQTIKDQIVCILSKF